MSETPLSPLEAEVIELRQRLDAMAERVRLDAQAAAFLRGDHPVREGDYCVIDGFPTRVSSIASDGKWTYFNGRNSIEPFRVPPSDDIQRLYTIEEVEEIVSKAQKETNRYERFDPFVVISPGALLVIDGSPRPDSLMFKVPQTGSLMITNGSDQPVYVRIPTRVVGATPPPNKVGEPDDALIDRICFQIGQAHDTSELWSHMRSDPAAFRAAILAALRMP